MAFVLSMNTNKKIDKEMNSKNGQAEATETGKDTTKMQENFSKKTSMLDIIAGKQAVRCTFKKTDEKTQIEGTLYTDGNNARTNVNTTVDGNLITANTIVNGNTVYIWQSDAAQGMQMDIEKFKQQSKESTDSMDSDTNKTNTASKADELLDYNCSKWSVNPDMFVVPTGINFVDITEAMKKIQQSPCAICDAMEDATRKAQCKQSLNCK